MIIGRAKNATAVRDLIYEAFKIRGVIDSTSVIAHTVVSQSLAVEI
jgi:hypothetical protein